MSLLRDNIISLIKNPGYRSKILYQISHFFWNRNMKSLAWITFSINYLLSHSGIEPGAKLHKTVTIVHGSIFIGSTSEIGQNCVILQNVTIGAKIKGSGKNLSRTHPILENDVTVSAGAVILGSIKIGHHSVIGPNSVVTRSIPPYSLAYGVPAKIYKLKGSPTNISSPIGLNG